MTETNKDIGVAENPSFTIHLQYLKDLSFENPNTLAHLTDKNEIKPDININVQVNAKHLSESMFEVVLEVSAEAKRAKDIMFICQVQYAALVSLEGEKKEDAEVRKILLEDCPQLLFPFARNVISETTRDSGFPPLLLQPVDFVKLNKSQTAEINENNSGNVH